MKTILTGTVFAFVTIIGAVVGITVYRFWIQEVAVAQAPSPRLDADVPVVHALGSIQPFDGIIALAAPAGLRAISYDTAVMVGGMVKKDNPLAYLDGYDERRFELAVIKEEIEAAVRNTRNENDNERAALDDIQRECEKKVRLGRMQLESAELKIKCLKDKYDYARKQVEDVEGLQRNNTISRQHYEQLEIQAKISLSELEFARAEKERQQQELDLSTSADAMERQKRSVRFAAQRARALLPVDTLRRKLALAEAAMKRCVIVAPIDGTVLEITTKAGESSAGKPLLKLGDTSRLYVLAEVYEDNRKDVQLKDKAEIRGRGLPLKSEAPLLGVVARIGSLVVGHKQSPLDPTYRENARVYEVWIKLEPDENSIALDQIRNFILQPVDVMIRINRGR